MSSSGVLFDSHCHLDFAAFDQDRAALWQACQAAGVQQLLLPGVTPAQWPRLAQLCEAFEGWNFALGIHPWWIADLGQNLDLALANAESDLVRLAPNPKVLAVGETGLDKAITTPLAVQQQLLDWHIRLANQVRKPLIVHSVKAHNELIAQFKRHRPEYGGVIHGFTGSYETACQFIQLGFFLGVGGTITYSRAQKTRAALSRVPLQSLVLETDAPDMPLAGKQGARNSPEYLPQIAQQLAQLRGIAVADLMQATWDNSCRLFQIDQGVGAFKL